MDRIDALLRVPIWPDDPLVEIRRLGAGRTVVALDDDPTGTQTVRGVPVLTRWSPDRLRSLLASDERLVFLLTNSRSRSGTAAQGLAREVGEALREAAAAAHPWSVISRSDSTLRGHFPLEVDALVAALGITDARVLLAPFLGDAGRITVDGIHHVRLDDRLVPVAETEFARDPVFGYGRSDLVGWVEERTRATGGRTRDVKALPLDRIRLDGPEVVRRALHDLPAGAVLVVDAADERDIEVVALGSLLAEIDGVPMIGRTAAAYVRARAGAVRVTSDDALSVPGGSPGLVVVGSHVPTTTGQLDALLGRPPVPIEHIQLAVDAVGLDRPSARVPDPVSLARSVERILRDGRTAVLSTSRTLVRGRDVDEDLRIAARVSDALVRIVRAVDVRPAWVLTKGGITSSDIATGALDVAEALVVGPLLPGVPVWRCGGDSRWPGLRLVVFPGNVGGTDALREAVSSMAYGSGGEGPTADPDSAGPGSRQVASTR